MSHGSQHPETPTQEPQEKGHRTLQWHCEGECTIRRVLPSPGGPLSAWGVWRHAQVHEAWLASLVQNNRLQVPGRATDTIFPVVLFLTKPKKRITKVTWNAESAQNTPFFWKIQVGSRLGWVDRVVLFWHYFYLYTIQMSFGFLWCLARTSLASMRFFNLKKVRKKITILYSDVTGWKAHLWPRI